MCFDEFTGVDKGREEPELLAVWLRQSQQLINDEFAIALQLLQNDILMICMNAGVPIDQLYPGEALLLNLYALQLHCFENI